MFCRNIVSITHCQPCVITTGWSVGSEFCIVDRLIHRLLSDGVEMSGHTVRNDGKVEGSSNEPMS